MAARSEVVRANHRWSCIRSVTTFFTNPQPSLGSHHQSLSHLYPLLMIYRVLGIAWSFYISLRQTKMLVAQRSRWGSEWAADAVACSGRASLQKEVHQVPPEQVWALVPMGQLTVSVNDGDLVVVGRAGTAAPRPASASSRTRTGPQSVALVPAAPAAGGSRLAS